ncbi:hypothetical protein [Desulfolutivibrio sp.]|uniref:hypothetical protein n=1 Tax=Desulfolutivibrio sp. TaxID=2773296 RepID=UPI002F96E56D
MTTKRNDQADRLACLRRAHADRPVPGVNERAVRAIMARIDELPAYRRKEPFHIPWERLSRVFYPFAAASAVAAGVCAVWSLSLEQGLDWLLLRTVLADPTGLSALRLAGL